MDPNQAKVICSILQFTDDFRKRNIELRVNGDNSGNSNSENNLEKKFLARKISVNQPSVECAQM
jgi:hypothetical protein